MDYYWVGDSGDWDDSDHWSDMSGGSGGFGVPGSSDNAIIDSNSFSGTGETITLVGNIVHAQIYINGAYDFTWATGSYDIEIDQAGSLMNSLFAVDSNVTVTSSGGTITINGYSMESVNVQLYASIAKDMYVNPMGGSIYLAGSIGSNDLYIDLTASSNSNLYADGFTCGDVDVTGGSSDGYFRFGGNLSCTSLTFDTDTNVDSTSSSHCLYLNENSGGNCLTYTKSSTRLSLGLKVYIQGNSEFHPGEDSSVTELHINSTIGSGEVKLYDGFTIGSFYVDSYPKTIKWEEGETFTVETSFNGSGTSGNLISHKSTTDTSTWYLSSSHDIVLDYLYLKDSHVSGGANYNAGANSTDDGGNDGWSWGITTYTKNFVDQYTFVESFAKKLTLIRLFSEEYDIGENFDKAKVYIRSFIDSSSLIEYFKGYWNGLNIWWVRIKKTIGSWSNTERVTSSWSNTERVTSSWNETEKEI